MRAALTLLQSKKGKEKPMELLGKYSSTKTIGGLPKDKYGALIAECQAEAAK